MYKLHPSYIADSDESDERQPSFKKNNLPFITAEMRGNYLKDENIRLKRELRQITKKYDRFDLTLEDHNIDGAVMNEHLRELNPRERKELELQEQHLYKMRKDANIHYGHSRQQTAKQIEVINNFILRRRQ